ncbi:hypothetical protein Voc01_064840 [Virgisporangium ochraceum]|uniref:histidine kinase n=2 Tax=Virgisporangium ochraceum TaxID=65505 RepID=A0A8J3ZWT1_9ACTN|nr:hypothetical protein Voc01_064840 [Virgisporangium ochraceum]
MRLVGAVGVTVVAVAGAELWLGLRHTVGPPSMVVFGVATAVVFAGCGVGAWAVRPRSRSGLWMLALAGVMLVDLPNQMMLPTDLPGRGLITLVGVPAHWFVFAVGAQLFLSYPSGRLTAGPERVVVRAAFALAAVAGPLLLVTKTPVPFICDGWCGPSPVQLVDDVDLYLGLRTAVIVGWLVLAGCVLVLLVRRIGRAGRRQRRIITLFVAGGVVCVASLAAAHTLLVTFYWVDEPPRDFTVYDIVLGTGAQAGAAIGVPIAFLFGLLRQRLAFASIGSLVGRLQQAGPETLSVMLGQILRDPTLRVVYPTPGGPVDVTGRSVPADLDPGRVRTPVGDPPTAFLEHDVDVRADAELLAAATAAARLALDNARLQAEVRAQLAEVRASRLRIAAAADAERQRLERDLHDGAQQRLLGVGLALGVLRAELGDAHHGLVDEMERELRGAIGDLRDVAQGIRPAVLTDQGLEPALAILARAAAVPVHLDVRLSGRLDPVVEATAYYVVSEALQNVVKHARAASASVTAVHIDGRLRVDVADDGRGGAAPGSGTGLRGLADRVDAVGGSLRIESPRGAGTALRMDLPCA